LEGQAINLHDFQSLEAGQNLGLSFYSYSSFAHLCAGQIGAAADEDCAALIGSSGKVARIPKDANAAPRKDARPGMLPRFLLFRSPRRACRTSRPGIRCPCDRKVCLLHLLS